ncbi:T9SS type A sorting domain-containing protein [uncultured Arcticibacterium sp.]|uniref:T9SS type A sorting domain-containing protein n=1 Tax=uncultured Arcticibacterium sp. TaxID=2173042 RepID=UPI0030FC0FDC
MKKLAILACLAFMSSMVYAQSESSTVTIRVEKIVDGEKEVTVRKINTAGMTDAERDAVIENVQDSLIGDVNSKKRLKVVIEDDRDVFMGEQDEELELSEDENGVWQHYDSEHDNEVRIYKKNRKGGNDWKEDFEIEMERFGDNMKMLGEEIPYRIEKHLPRFYAWSDNVLAEVGNSPIRSLDVFPNKPNSDVINVKFFAPQEGDVSISVIDTKGKVVAQKETKDFKGEFVGQIDLKKGLKGTHFVIVSQGEDGISRRVVLD